MRRADKTQASPREQARAATDTAFELMPSPAPRSPWAVDYQNLARPVAILAHDYAQSHHQSPHSHPRGQLIFATRGVVTVLVAGGSFTIPPQRAMWIPPGIEHETFHDGNLALRSLYISPEACSGLSPTPQVIFVSSLLHELIVAAAQEPVDYELGGRAELMMQLILAEIAGSQYLPLVVPMPRQPRLVSFCKSVLQDTAAPVSLEAAAASCCMGRRTFTRAFRRETGKSLADWVRHARLMRAVALLSAGRDVTSVAFDVGYRTPSAFTAMFRTMLGAPPSHYVGRRAAH